MVEFDYQIIRRPRRKTASISVKPDCSVRVVVPASLPEHKIVDLVKRKSNWIINKIIHFQEIKKSHKVKEYVSGESFTYLGRNYRLKVVSGDGDVKLVNGRFYVPVPSETSDKDRDSIVVQQLTNWYAEHAMDRLIEKTKRYGQQIGVSPTSVGIKGFRSRWGSCHSDGRIYFNWRIIIAPHSIVDYVVVHELCHLVHNDHGKKFWKLLESIIPDYAARKQWLKVHGSSLIL